MSSKQYSGFRSKEELADLDAQPLSAKEFWNEQPKILKEIYTSSPAKPKTKGVNAPKILGTPTLKQIREATMRGEVIIDKVCILVYPLDDPRTEPDRRALYLAQEELMMQPDDAEEPDLSSPAHDSLDINWTEIAVRGLKYMTPEDRSKCRAAERAFIEKAYGVKFDE
jgi:hypothetical protein